MADLNRLRLPPAEGKFGRWGTKNNNKKDLQTANMVLALTPLENVVSP
jgi:hypothetical protein